MTTERHQAEADLFFRHIADHGRFAECQLYRFVELRTGEPLGERERRALLRYARDLGAVREKGLAEVYAFPISGGQERRRRAVSEMQLELVGSSDDNPNQAVPTRERLR